MLLPMISNSGEYGICGKVVRLNEAIVSFVLTLMCGLALFCLRKKLSNFFPFRHTSVPPSERGFKSQTLYH